MKFVQAFRVACKADCIAVFPALTCVSIDGGAAALQVGHEATIGRAVRAYAVCDRCPSLGRCDIVSLKVKRLCWFRKIFEFEGGPF